jgi:hypothetical protein
VTDRTRIDPPLWRIPLIAVEVALALIAIGAFSAAEMWRRSFGEWPTMASKLGWCCWMLLVLVPLRNRILSLSFLRFLVLWVLAAFTLLAYLNRSGIVAAGPHVDAVYTWTALGWFLENHNPIVFGGSTYSYAQFPLFLLIHLPVQLIGFHLVGPGAPLLGAVIFLAALVAFLVLFLVPRTLLWQALTAVMFCACFSNRLFLQAYGPYPYMLTSLMYAFLLFLLLESEAAAENKSAKAALTLLALSLLLYYTAFLYLLPALLLAAFFTRHRITWLSLVGDNRLLMGSVVLLAITCLLHPNLLAQRVAEVSIRSATDNAEYLNKVLISFASFIPDLQRFGQRWTTSEMDGSWHFLKIPPLGGGLAALTLVNLLISIAVTKPAWWRKLAWALFFIFTFLVTALFVIATDWDDKRAACFVWPTVAAGLFFVLVIPRLTFWPKAVLFAYALALGIFNYWDIACLDGQRYESRDYAPLAQESMESFRQMLRGGESTEKGKLFVVTEDLFPLFNLYRPELSENYGIDLVHIPATRFCGAADRALRDAGARAGQSAQLLYNAKLCAGAPLTLPGVRAMTKLGPSIELLKFTL